MFYLAILYVCLYDPPISVGRITCADETAFVARMRFEDRKKHGLRGYGEADCLAHGFRHIRSIAGNREIESVRIRCEKADAKY